MLPFGISYNYIQNSTVPNVKCFSFGCVDVPAVDVTLQVIFYSLCNTFVLSVADTFIFNGKTAFKNI